MWPSARDAVDLGERVVHADVAQVAVEVGDADRRRLEQRVEQRRGVLAVRCAVRSSVTSSKRDDDDVGGCRRAAAAASAEATIDSVPPGVCAVDVRCRRRARPRSEARVLGARSRRQRLAGRPGRRPGSRRTRSDARAPSGNCPPTARSAAVFAHRAAAGAGLDRGSPGSGAGSRIASSQAAALRVAVCPAVALSQFSLRSGDGLAPFAPRARIEADIRDSGGLRGGDHDRGGDARAAVGDGVRARRSRPPRSSRSRSVAGSSKRPPRRELRERHVARAGDVAGHRVDRLDLAAVALGRAGVEQGEGVAPRSRSSAIVATSSLRGARAEVARRSR